MRPKILILSAAEGHASIAKAVKDYLKPVSSKVEIVNLMNDGLGFGAYRAIYRFSPSLFKIPFKLAQMNKIRQMFKIYIQNTKRAQIIDVIKKYDPDVIITTHFGYLPVLDEIKPLTKFKHINVVTDPITVHPLLYSYEADFNLGFNADFFELGIRLGIPKSRLLPIGWLTHPDFFKKLDKQKIRQEIGFNDDLTLLICWGSEGSNSIISLLPILFLPKHPRPIQIIFIAGSNTGLKKLIEQSYKLAKKVNPDIARVHVVGFTDEMAKYMEISDVVIGKAGPNLIFEAAAKMKPFIAITHISGQEDGNLDLIRKYDLGWVAEDLSIFNPLLKKIIKSDILKDKEKSIKKMAEKNKQAGLKLVELVKKLVAEKAG
ncbi:MAG: hypothetical protein GXP43_00270 [bacterium]|nr:hypothetical protein [bacterium]